MEVKKSVFVFLSLVLFFSFVQPVFVVAVDKGEVLIAVRANAEDVPKDIPEKSFCAFDYAVNKEVCMAVLAVKFSNNEFFITLPSKGSIEPEIIRYSLEYGFIKNNFETKKQTLQDKNVQKQSKPVALKVDVAGKERNILVSKKNKETFFESNGVSAKTSKNLEIDDKNIKVDGQIVNILPENALAKIVEFENKVVEKNITLDADNKGVIYTIETKTEGKLFGLIPLDVHINAKVDALSGEIKELQKPFWADLVK